MTYVPDLSRYAGIKPEKLPKKWYPLYVVYRYSFSKSTYIVGFDTDEAADKFQQELLGKKDLTRCEIFGHFPLDLLIEDYCDFCKGTGEHYCPDVAQPILIKCTKKGCKHV